MYPKRIGIVMSNRKCTECLNHEYDPEETTCKLKLNNENLKRIRDCQYYEANKGFQIGGYWTHMHFELSGENSSCLEWFIHGDGEFPSNEECIQFHICEFRQIERWVKFWGKELRRRGWIRKTSRWSYLKNKFRILKNRNTHEHKKIT